MTAEQRMEVHAEAEVIWGPDPADVAAWMHREACSEEEARAALVRAHDDEEQT